MKYQIIFSKNARDDLLSSIKYIREKLLSPGSADKLSQRILSEIKTLDEMPMRYPLCENKDWKSLGLRVLPIDHYLVFYLPDEVKKLVKIYRIIYSGRDIDNQLKENIVFE